MKRRVIEQGGKTLMVSLPIKWAERFHIKKGDELEISLEGNRACFSATGEPTVENVSVDLEGMNERSIRYLLSGLHKSGYDEITIYYNSIENLAIIEDLVKNLYVGFAIVEQDGKRCVLRPISKELPSEFEAALRRAFLVTLSMGEAVIDSIKSGKNKQLVAIESLEKTNNQLTNFCQRLLNKDPFIAANRQSFLYVICWNLEKICDQYKYICNEFKGKSKGPGNNVVKWLEDATALLRGYYELFYKFEIAKLSELSETGKKLQGNILKELGKLHEDDARLAYYALCIANQAVEFSASMAAVRYRQS